MEIYLHTILILMIIIPLLFFYKLFSFSNKLLQERHRELLFNRFSELVAIYVFSKENSFKSLYKQKISVLYTSKSDTISKKDEISNLEKVFIKRAIEMCGTNIVKDLSDIYGGTDSLIRDLSEYYYSKIIQLEAGTIALDDDDDDYAEDSPKVKDKLFIK